MRAYALQLETLRRVRAREAPVVRVENIQINDEGQAVIGAAVINGSRTPA
jgi:hypothetical protein